MIIPLVKRYIFAPLPSWLKKDQIFQTVIWIILIFITVQPSSAEPFFVLGPKPLGMAGAYVSVEDNQSAFYWNPAKYSFNKTALFELPLGIELIATHDIVKELDEVEQSVREGTPPIQFINEVNDLKKEKMGLIAQAYGGISLQYHHYALSFLEQRLAAGNPYFKTIDQYGREEPYLQIKYIKLQEFILTHSRCLTDNLSLGANLKVLVGKLDYALPHAYKDKDVEKKVKITIEETQAQTTTNLGLDLGLIYSPSDNLNLGLVIRHLNSPQFSYPSSASLEDYQLKRQIRGGISYKTKRQGILALDCDVIKNDTLLQGYQSQNLSVGLAYPLYKEHLVLRCGGMKNLVEDDIGNIYTLGLGLHFFNLAADISAGVSSKKTKISKTGDKYPVNLIGSFQLALIF